MGSWYSQALLAETSFLLAIRVRPSEGSCPREADYTRDCGLSGGTGVRRAGEKRRELRKSCAARGSFRYIQSKFSKKPDSFAADPWTERGLTWNPTPSAESPFENSQNPFQNSCPTPRGDLAFLAIRLTSSDRPLLEATTLKGAGLGRLDRNAENDGLCSGRLSQRVLRSVISVEVLEL